MELIKQPEVHPASLALFPGAFNPPTRAHLALAEAALQIVDAALFVLPRSFPHKEYSGATLEDRAEMLRVMSEANPRLGAAISDRGLFFEVAREARVQHPHAELYVLCGRDAAKRMIEWDYGEPAAVERMLEQFQLLVAPRGGPYEAPDHLKHAVRTITTDNFDKYSSTLVREAMASGRDWRTLTPDQIAEIIERIYK